MRRPGFKKYVAVLAAFALLTSAASAFAQAPPDKAKAQPAAREQSVDPYAIGCLLPLSGKFAVTGSKTLDAIMMAFDIFKPGYSSPFKLVVEDTKGSPDAVTAAITRMVNEHRVIAILGPLGSAESEQAARVAQQMKVPIITLTQRGKITETGDYVFRSFLTAAKQMEALVSYAMNDAGMKRFAILYPEDQYGREMAGLFRSEVGKRRGGVVKSLSYRKGQTDFGAEIKSIAAVAVMRKKGKSRDAAPQDEDFRPSVAFDALFIPDNLAALDLIAPQLAFYNVKGVKLLGTGYWNHARVIKLNEETDDASPATVLMDGVLFADGFSANSYIGEAGRFADAFFAAFDREPGTLEAMAYDAARISAEIVTQKRAASREAFRDRLLNVENYTGATGRTSFRHSRDAGKEAFILTIREGQIVPLKSFFSVRERDKKR